MAKRENKKNGMLCVAYAQSGKHATAQIDAIPTVCVIINISDHIQNNIMAVIGYNALTKPVSVATPLPPLPRKKIEQPLPNKRIAAKTQR